MFCPKSCFSVFTRTRQFEKASPLLTDPIAANFAEVHSPRDA